MYFKIELQSIENPLNVRLEELIIMLNLQMAHISLPALKAGQAVNSSNPDIKYYWRMRARNASGVWSKWSLI